MACVVPLTNEPKHFQFTITQSFKSRGTGVGSIEDKPPQELRHHLVEYDEIRRALGRAFTLRLQSSTPPAQMMTFVMMPAGKNSSGFMCRCAIPC